MTTDDVLAYMLSRYGEAFTDPKRDPQAVRAEWEQVLTRLSAVTLANALEHLPSYPLSALGFHALAVMHAPPTVAARTTPKPMQPVTHSPAKQKALARLAELRTAFVRGKQ